MNSVFGGAPGGAAHPHGISGDALGYGPELLDDPERLQLLLPMADDTGLHDALLDAMLSVYLSNVSVRQNEDMRKISAWAAMITVATLIAGIYGMNFRHMPELAWPYGYPFALVLMAGACLLLFRAFRRSGWL